MKKKIITLVSVAAALTLAAFATLFAFAASAKATFSLSSAKGEYKPSENVSVSVVVSGANAVSGVQADVNFDPAVFEFVSAAKAPSGWYLEAAQVKSGKVRILCYDDSAGAAMSGKIDVCSASLRVKSAAKNGNYEINADNVVLSDKNGKALAFSVSGAVHAAVKAASLPEKPKPAKKLKNGWVGGKYYKNDKLKKNYWISAKGKKYRADKNGRMTKNTVKKINGRYYAFAKSGVLQKGNKIVTVKGKRYYASKKGTLKTSRWIKYKRKWYRASKNGALVCGKKLKLGRKVYRFNKKCVCQNK